MSKPDDDGNIYMSAPVNLNHRLPGGIGLRQVVLIGVAVAQAIYLVFVFDGLPFAVRLIVASLVAMVLLALAVVRPRGDSPEGLLMSLLRWLLQPRYRVFQTAERVDHRLHSAADVVGDGAPARAEPARAAWPLAWDRANIALIVFLFMALMTTSTTWLWFANHGHLSGLGRW